MEFSDDGPRPHNYRDRLQSLDNVGRVLNEAARKADVCCVLGGAYRSTAAGRGVMWELGGDRAFRCADVGALAQDRQRHSDRELALERRQDAGLALPESSLASLWGL